MLGRAGVTGTRHHTIEGTNCLRNFVMSLISIFSEITFDDTIFHQLKNRFGSLFFLYFFFIVKILIQRALSIKKKWFPLFGVD
jgi:hypothetical protein